jgi:hypothetical protein
MLISNWRSKTGVLIFASAILLIFSAFYTYQNRYYFRFLPIPLALIELVNNDSAVFPAVQKANPKGTVSLQHYDITSRSGLRKTLTAIQNLSPYARTSGFVDYNNITFEKWISEIHNKPFFCTDATLIFISVARAQGLKAREWHLLPNGWPPGAGHSVAEFFNSRTRTWQLVDAQHAGIIVGNNGSILDMATVLNRYKEGGRKNIKVDYGPFEKQILAGARGLTVEQLFFDQNLLQNPVLQLRQATWYAEVEQNFLMSGHFVIGYPIVMSRWAHDNRVIFSKLTALVMILSTLSIILSLIKMRSLARIENS